MELSKQIKNMLTEGCADILAYLETESLPERTVIFALIENQDALNNLENLILQLSRIFGGIAFKNDEGLEIFKGKVRDVYKRYPEFKVLQKIYLKEITLKDINIEISDEDMKIQQAKLEAFINTI